MQTRANRMVNRTSEALEARRGNVQPPYNLVGVLGTRNVDVIEKEG